MKSNWLKSNWRTNICFRLISTVLAFALWGIIVVGPFQYKRQKNGDPDDDANQLQFFDCFGPLIFYSLGTLTVIWWSCHLRVLIGPKEHLLLYNKLLLHRPTRRYDSSGTKEHHYNTPRTDWAALTNMSQATLIDTFTFAHRKGFLDLWYVNMWLITSFI